MEIITINNEKYVVEYKVLYKSKSNIDNIKKMFLEKYIILIPKNIGEHILIVSQIIDAEFKDIK